jgi:hypothetical protein
MLQEVRDTRMSIPGKLLEINKVLMFVCQAVDHSYYKTIIMVVFVICMAVYVTHFMKV